MATYVLVGGAWLGGWCWQEVTRSLRQAGHEVYPGTLTGLGERAHVASRDVDLETHITDVVNLAELEDLREMILVGHSYAGIVVTGVADRIPNHISLLAYLDAGPVPDGTSYLETQSPEVKQLIERRVAEEGDGWRLPMPSWEELENVYGASLEGLDEDLLESWRSRAVDQPFGTYTRPLRLESPARKAMPKLLIACSFPLEQVRELIAQDHPWFREMAGPEWHLEELPTGHWPMFSRPDDLAVLLHGLAPDVAAEDRSARGGFANHTTGRTPMGERTTEGAALDLGRLEDFFVRYGEAVSAGDLKAISGCYAVPSIVLSDAGSIPIATREEIEAAFDGAAERYRAQGMVAARPTVVAVENLTEKLAFADVRWDYLDEEGRSTEQNIYRYVLRLEDAGPRICALIATSPGG
jgi:pimeloyl-ACP methyl ester carboxylesterase